MTRGVCLARKDIGNAYEAHIAGGAEGKAGVNAVLRVLYPLQIHGERAVYKHYYLAELARIVYHFDEVCLFFVEGKQGNAVGVGLIIEVNALAAEAGQKHYRRVVIIVCIRIFEVGSIKILPHFAYVRQAGRRGRYPLFVAVQIGVVHRHIYIKARRIEGVKKAAPARSLERRAAAVCSIYGIFYRIAEQRYAELVRGKRKGIIFVTDHDRALFHRADIEVVFRLNEFLVVFGVEFAELTFIHDLAAHIC